MRHRFVILAAVGLVFAAQACCCCDLIGGPQPPHTITPSDEAVREFEERMASAEDGAGEAFSVTITEKEMTSLVAQVIEEQENPLPFSGVQVHFRNQQIEVYATLEAAQSLTLPGMIAFSLEPGDDGPLAVSIEEAELGPMPIPQAALEALTDLINETLSENLQVSGTVPNITEVEIDDGEMTLTGRMPNN